MLADNMYLTSCKIFELGAMKTRLMKTKTLQNKDVSRKIPAE